jgi:hypothetical protein
MQITWKIRVAAALVLASLLQMSDGNQFWATTLPTVLGAGAIAVAAGGLLTRR